MTLKEKLFAEGDWEPLAATLAKKYAVRCNAPAALLIYTKPDSFAISPANRWILLLPWSAPVCCVNNSFLKHSQPVARLWTVMSNLKNLTYRLCQTVFGIYVLWFPWYLYKYLLSSFYVREKAIIIYLISTGFFIPAIHFWRNINNLITLYLIVCLISYSIS